METRATAFATKHAIPVVHGSYDELLADPDVDAVYNPLPNGLHAEWTLRALAAGKHVLCEKPFAANAAEAQPGQGRRGPHQPRAVMEAFHWRYLPPGPPHGRDHRQRRARPTLPLVVEAALAFPLAARNDIRWQLDLAGGALMDAGCYAVHMVRTMAGAEPRVMSATARLRSPGVDRYMRAELEFPGGVTGRITTSMWSSTILRLRGRGRRGAGDDAGLQPHAAHPLPPPDRRRPSPEAPWHERIRGGHTYDYQLEAFVAAVRHGVPTLTPPAESVANMRVIDDIYRAAGPETSHGGNRPRPRLLGRDEAAPEGGWCNCTIGSVPGSARGHSREVRGPPSGERRGPERMVTVGTARPRTHS